MKSTCRPWKLVAVGVGYANLCLAQNLDKQVLATPATVVWGYYHAKAPPILTIHSGATVKFQTVSSCGLPSELVKAGRRPEEIPEYYKNI